MMTNKILLIEDKLEIAENISSMLKLARYTVIHAPNGKKGVEMAQNEHPDLILCEVMMSGLDGYGVIHILSRDASTANIPFIFLSAKIENKDFRVGMNLGADDYITTPFDGIDLLKVIEIRLKKSEWLKSKAEHYPQEFNTFFAKEKELKEFDRITENRPVRNFKKKDLIFMEGQSPNHLFFIDKGQVKTYKVNYFGKELITGIHRKGQFLGYGPLLDEKPYSENAEVLEDVKLSMIPKSDFLTLIYSNKEVARRFIKMLSNNLEEMENRLLEIAYQSVRQRVASALLKIDEKFSETEPNEIIATARRDISNIIGTTTESLNRTLADFKEERLIEISVDGLKILNKPKLERIICQ